MILLLYSGSYMSAHELVNLLNNLRKRDYMQGLQSILSHLRPSACKTVSTDILSGLNWVLTVFNSYQLMTLAGKELK